MIEIKLKTGRVRNLKMMKFMLVKSNNSLGDIGKLFLSSANKILPNNTLMQVLSNLGVVAGS